MCKYIFITCILLLFTLYAKAQFIITESFKGGISSNIITGGNATLTSGNVDPVNDGWLRLTATKGNQTGYAYVNSSFPSTLGVMMEFEYKTWRDTSDGYNGADGFCIFFFDAATTAFKIGGYGGSLGYAPNTGQGATTGLAGGYIGIGFDEYGNFSNGSEGRNGGVGEKPNSITLRGPTTSNSTTTNTYLTGKQMQESRSSNTNSIDYNTITSKRPTDATFYRKVKITIIPTANGLYKIDAYWQTSTSGSYTSLLSYTTTTPPPKNLKLGFAASTGGGFNYHEIRNIYITTTGNIRVNKAVDKSNVNLNDVLTYTVDVENENTLALTGVILADTLKASNGSNLVLGSNFGITSITFNNNGNSATTASGYTNGVAKTSGFTNPWSTTLNMAANSKATFTIVGKALSQPTGNVVKNSVGIDVGPSGVIDPDLTNNYATVTNTVLSPNVDFTISKVLDKSCADPVNGNTYTLVVSNMGATASEQNKQVTVTDVIPNGLTVDGIPGGANWTTSVNGNTYTFTRTGTLASSYAYEPITIKVKPPTTTGISWTNTASVSYAGTDNNTNNNSSSVTLYAKPTLVITNPAAVCSPNTVNLTATAITAGSSSNLSYAYYTDAAGTTVLNNPGAVSVSGTYYIQATNTTGCTSAIMPVTVKINYSLSGTVFNDRNGLTDNIVNGIGTNAGNTLYIVVYNNTTSKIENVISVASNGTYSSCTSTIGNSYTLYLTTTSSLTIGQTVVPALTLSSLARYTGEHIGVGAGSDGAADGKIALGVINGNISDINFGIRFMRSCVITNKNVTKQL